MLLDLGDQHPDFDRHGSGKRGDPYIWRFTGDITEETFEEMLEREAQEKGDTSVPVEAISLDEVGS
jgi:hypothetical protein